MNLAQILQMYVQTVTQPRAAAERVLGLDLRGEALWLAGALVVVLFPLSLAPQIALLAPADALATMTSTPVLSLGLIAGQLFGTIVAIWVACRLLGATVTLEDVGALFVWLQGLQIVVQVLASLLAILGLASLGGILTSLLFVVTFWISAQFIDVLTGFGNLFKSFGAYLLGALFLGLVVLIVLSTMGFSPMEVMTNV